jgi:hypothetical protein
MTVHGAPRPRQAARPGWGRPQASHSAGRLAISQKGAGPEQVWIITATSGGPRVGPATPTPRQLPPAGHKPDLALTRKGW